MILCSRPGACCALALLAFLAHCATAVQRHYYIAAVNINWDYSAVGNERVGPTYKKTVYREYEPGFKQAKTHPSWSGLLGPTLRGQNGDTIVVTFKNMADRPCSIHPHGIAYGKQSEGSLYFDNTSEFEKEDDVIDPDEEHTYSWEVTPDVTPKATDPPCVTYMYFSHVDFVKDYNTGLIGTLLICKNGSLDDSGNQVHFHQEFVLLFGVFDENNSWYSKRGTPLEKNVKYTINGYTNGDVPDLSVCAHSKITWHFLGMSSEPELFSVHLNGQVLQQGGHKVSSVGIISGTATSADMVAIHEGRWLLSSHISKHLEAGMHGFLTINMCEEFTAPKREITIQQSRESQEWTYYIAAEEIIWDYAPNMPDNVDGYTRQTPFSAERIGKKYKKAVFTQYKDESFKERAENKQRKKEVGILGPVIRAQIRDIITIVFKNKASRPYSIYPHGLTIDKTAEGANYPEGGHHAVQPGETHTYVWRVIVEDEPLQNDSRCLTRMYHSAVNTPRDIASGLIGPLLICKSQSLNTRNVQLRADKEQHAMFAVFDENKSWYLDENINTYCEDPKRVKKDDTDFYKSNVMHTINGYVYESGQVLGFCNGEIVTWHVSSVGEQDGIQTATFYGHTFELNNREEDILSLFPMTGETISMKMANDGIWLLASLNTHETTKGVRLKFKDVECFRDYVAENDYSAEEEAYGTETDTYVQWVPINETEAIKEKTKSLPIKNQPVDKETDIYADMLGLRTFSNPGNSTNDMEKLDLTFFDHDEGVLLEDSSPSLTDKIQNTTNPELEHSKLNQSEVILSEEGFDDKSITSEGVQNETLLRVTVDKARAYYITAEEVDWDYAGYGQRPTRFKKVVFREYLDISFTTPYVRGEVEEHLGILGPVIKAEVDETIFVMFRNLASRPYSLHANGVSYGKNMEGLKYEDESPYWYRQDDVVQPNTTFFYMWTVNSKVGPLQSESDCRIWAYYSGVNPERDIHSGLIGPLLVCRKGTLNKNPINTRDFMLLFMTFDETKSWYYETNRHKLLIFSVRVSINGIIYSLKGLRMYTKQLVKWHLINMGSPKDFHSIHFHGQTFLNKHTRDQRQGVYPLLPGGFATLEMEPSKPGLWLLESEIGISQQMGMQTLFLVLDNVCEHPLGLISGAVKDSQITASDSRSYWLPSLARLHNTGKYNAWSTTSKDPWIQVDFQRPVVVSKVATQGAKQLFSSHFVLNYTISYSTDRKRWIYYKGDSKLSRKASNLTFEGNREAHEVKENIFFPPIIGRFMRLHPSHSYNYPTVRMEFYGCELDGCSVPLGMQSGQINDHQITASSVASNWYSGSWNPWFARLDKQGAVNAWQAKSNDMQPWLLIELKEVKKITGIVTQGAKSLGKEMFITTYVLEYSDDGKKWTKYTDDQDYEQKVQTFTGNSDTNGHMKNYIYPPIFSKFIRIIPRGWQGSVTMRVELLGCDFE
uniref:ferroxidase n=1 Tax=Pygocentrus nattereri TaxID=42514 RepID=A0AAR2IT94_PYGNA